MTMLRVLHLESGRHLYGGALQVLYLIRGLAAAGHDNSLACPLGSAIAASDPTARIIALPMRGEIDPRAVFSLWRALRRERPSLLHVHSRRGADLWGGIAAKLAGVPAVVTRRVDNPEPAWLARRKYRLYRRVIAISPAIRTQLLATGLLPAGIDLVPSAVDTQRFHPAAADGRLRRELALPADAPLVGMIAQFIPRKGHMDLLRAIPLIAAQARHTRFLLFGRGPLREQIERHCRQAGLAGQVIFAGFRNDLERLLPELDVVIHPAALEGLGVSLLQAAAAAVPVVAYAVGGIPMVVRDGVSGRLVPKGDVAALAQAVAGLLTDKARARQLGEAGRRLVLAEFSISAMVGGNLAAYRRALAGG
jgi:glycosyltransferase involved in cell wall biosynthesis